MTRDWQDDTRTSYDADAAGYADRVRGLLDGSVRTVGPFFHPMQGRRLRLPAGVTCQARG